MKNEQALEAIKLVNEGKTVNEACEQVGISAGTYYRVKNGGVKRSFVRKPSAIGTGTVGNKSAALALLYKHVSFKTFQAVERDWS